MKRCFAILATGVLAACSSSSSPSAVNSPALTTFTYSAPQAPTATQSTAADTASTSVGQVVVAASSGDTAGASSAPELADSVGLEALGAAAVASPRSPPSDAAKQLVIKTKSGELATSGCYTVSGSTLTYNNCSYSYGGDTFTANGSLTATSSNVTWNLNFTVSATSSGETINWDGLWTGNINYTATSINGSCLSQNSGTASGTENATFAWTVGLDFINLTVSSSCDSAGGITGGTLEVRANESGTLNIYGYSQAGIEIIWSACDTFQVATSQG
ncbi:MAG: hypothetical protein ACLQDQ_00845 [Myxococcaceae bacterium]